MPYCEVGDEREVKGLGMVRRVAGHYSYKEAPTRCDVCGNDAAGVPWRGWFSCDDFCGAYALVETGECFVKVSSEQETK